MRFRAFFNIQLSQLVLRWRWLLPLISFSFLGYLLTNAILWRKASYVPALAVNAGRQIVNSWDALFTAYGNTYYMTFLIANLFLLLVCDSLPETSFGQFAAFRLGSRRQWWLGKSLSMLAASLLYTVAGFAILLVITSFTLGFGWEWSKFGNYGPNILVPDKYVATQSPLQAALTLFGMNVLGLWALGSLMQVITLLTRRYLFGYAAAMLSLVGGFAIAGSLVNVSPFLKLLPTVHNLSLIFYPFPFREIDMGWSYVYWLVWLGLLVPLGYWISRRQNYYAISGK